VPLQYLHAPTLTAIAQINELVAKGIECIRRQNTDFRNEFGERSNLRIFELAS
jgi:hypothetical protein